MSCSYCVLAGLNNLAVSSTCEGNHPAYRAIVGIEAKSDLFQPGPAADVSPQPRRAGTLRSGKPN